MSVAPEDAAAAIRVPPCRRTRIPVRVQDDAVPRRRVFHTLVEIEPEAADAAR
jgi:hypothetical protein